MFFININIFYHLKLEPDQNHKKYTQAKGSSSIPFQADENVMEIDNIVYVRCLVVKIFFIKRNIFYQTICVGSFNFR